MEGDIIKTYITKIGIYYKYLDYSDYEFKNFFANLTANPYSSAYRKYLEIDEFKCVKFIYTPIGAIAYTKCNDHQVAVDRFKDVLIPVFVVNDTQKKVDTKLFGAILDTNTKIANTYLTNWLNH